MFDLPFYSSLYLLLQVIISTRISENYHREAHKERIIQTSLWNCWLWYILWYISLNQPIPALFSCVCTSDNFRGTLLFGRALKTMKSKVVLLLMNCFVNHMMSLTITSEMCTFITLSDYLLEIIQIFLFFLLISFFYSGDLLLSVFACRCASSVNNFTFLTFS